MTNETSRALGEAGREPPSEEYWPTISPRFSDASRVVFIAEATGHE